MLKFALISLSRSVSHFVQVFMLFKISSAYLRFKKVKSYAACFSELSIFAKNPCNLTNFCYSWYMNLKIPSYFNMLENFQV